LLALSELELPLHVDVKLRGRMPCDFLPALHAAHYPDIDNSPLAEQKNAVIRQLQSQMAFMDQITFMRYMRFKLARMNRQQELKDKHQTFY